MKEEELSKKLKKQLEVIKKAYEKNGEKIKQKSLRNKKNN